MTLYKNRDNELRIKAEYKESYVSAGILYYAIYKEQGGDLLKALNFIISAYPTIINITAASLSKVPAGSYYYEMDIKVEDKTLSVENGTVTIEDRSEISS